MSDPEVGRFPFVAKDAILSAYRPGAVVTDNVFRTLRSAGFVSSGIDVRLRRAGRIVGQLRCYAALNIDAALLVRRSCNADARRLAKRASEFEKAWADAIRDVATEFDIARFEGLLDNRNRIAHALVPAVNDLERIRAHLSSSLEAAVKELRVCVSDAGREWTILRVLPELLREEPENHPLDWAIGSGSFLRAADQALWINSALAQGCRLGEGDYAILRIENFQGASLVTLLPAISSGEASQPPTEEDDAELDDLHAALIADIEWSANAIEVLESRRANGDFVSVPASTVRLAS